MWIALGCPGAGVSAFAAARRGEPRSLRRTEASASPSRPSKCLTLQHFEMRRRGWSVRIGRLSLAAIAAAPCTNSAVIGFALSGLPQSPVVRSSGFAAIIGECATWPAANPPRAYVGDRARLDLPALSGQTARTVAGDGRDQGFPVHLQRSWADERLGAEDPA
jgi:hypothetical protein